MRSHQALAVLAARQHGVVSFRQLRQLGYSTAAIARSSGAFRLRRVHRGVYAVGHDRIGDRGRCMAAVLACGPGTILSHAAAAWLWRIWPELPHEVEVTAARTGRRPGLRAHRGAALDSEWGHIDRIPVTDYPRTLRDVAATRSTRQLTNAVDDATRREWFDLGTVDAFLERSPRVPGSRPLRQALEIYRDPVFDRARSERLFLELVKQAGLPRPRINNWIGEFEIDAYWEAERFAVEVDGWTTHGNRRSFEADPVRAEDLKLAGIDVIRVTARRVECHPREVGRRLRLHLERRRRELRI